MLVVELVEVVVVDVELGGLAISYAVKQIPVAGSGLVLSALKR